MPLGVARLLVCWYWTPDHIFPWVGGKHMSASFGMHPRDHHACITSALQASINEVVLPSYGSSEHGPSILLMGHTGRLRLMYTSWP